MLVCCGNKKLALLVYKNISFENFSSLKLSVESRKVALQTVDSLLEKLYADVTWNIYLNIVS